MSVLLVTCGMLAVVGVVAVMAMWFDRFITWPEEEALERDERDISRGPSDWDRFRW